MCTLVTSEQSPILNPLQSRHSLCNVYVCAPTGKEPLQQGRRAGHELATVQDAGVSQGRVWVSMSIHAACDGCGSAWVYVLLMTGVGQHEFMFYLWQAWVSMSLRAAYDGRGSAWVYVLLMTGVGEHEFTFCFWRPWVSMSLCPAYDGRGSAWVNVLLMTGVGQHEFTYCLWRA